MAEIAHNPLDRLLNAVEIGEGWIDADRAVHEDATHPRVAAGVDDLRLADRGKHPFGGAGVSHWLTSATPQIVFKRHLSLFVTIIELRKKTEQIILRNHPPPRVLLPRKFKVFTGLDKNFTRTLLINTHCYLKFI